MERNLDVKRTKAISERRGWAGTFCAGLHLYCDSYSTERISQNKWSRCNAGVWHQSRSMSHFEFHQRLKLHTKLFWLRLRPQGIPGIWRGWGRDECIAKLWENSLKNFTVSYSFSTFLYDNFMTENHKLFAAVIFHMLNSRQDQKTIRSRDLCA